MPKHRDRRATPACAKIRPPLRGRPEKGAGRRRLLARSFAARLRCTPCQHPSPDDPDRCGLWVWALERPPHNRQEFI